jgi:hypothetical protein
VVLAPDSCIPIRKTLTGMHLVVRQRCETNVMSGGMDGRIVTINAIVIASPVSHQ